MQQPQLTQRMTRKVSNFDPVLIDIRKKLGANWVYYEECLEAIINASARHEDTSAWFEQMQKIIQGVNGVQIGHEGVLFLLRELVHGEARLVNEMPPPPLPNKVQQRKIAKPRTRLRPTYPQPSMPVSKFDFRAALQPAPVSAYLQQPSHNRTIQQPQFSRPGFKMGTNKNYFSNRSYPIQLNNAIYNNYTSNAKIAFDPFDEDDSARWDRFFDKENINRGAVQYHNLAQFGQQQRGHFDF